MWSGIDSNCRMAFEIPILLHLSCIICAVFRAVVTTLWDMIRAATVRTLRAHSSTFARRARASAISVQPNGNVVLSDGRRAQCPVHRGEVAGHPTGRAADRRNRHGNRARELVCETRHQRPGGGTTGFVPFEPGGAPVVSGTRRRAGRRRPIPVVVAAPLSETRPPGPLFGPCLAAADADADAPRIRAGLCSVIRAGRAPSPGVPSATGSAPLSVRRYAAEDFIGSRRAAAIDRQAD